ncbi:MAG: pantetheine-phosphate adenylyltransferase [Nitrososphaeraceae archaeon]
MVNKFRVVATGGTFDEIHDGHLALISKAFEVGKKVIIGVTSDEFAAKTKGRNRIHHSYEQRVVNLKEIIKNKVGGAVYEIYKLDDDYGPVVILPQISALVASAETAKKGDDINVIRSRNGLPSLTIIAVDMIRAEDGSPISSSRIRAGEIDASGRMLRFR